VNNVNTVTAALLCIEEPELYLHPHARRVVSRRLNEFIADRNQVILTTHSAEFLGTDGEEVHVLSVKHDPENGTRCIDVDLKEFAEVIISDSANEIFFADSVIVCEGLDDYIVRAIGQSLHPGKLDERNISIISVGGKDSVSKIVRLIIELGTRCYVVADFDYLLRDRDQEKCEEYGAKQHQSILSLKKRFFEQDCIFGTKGSEIHAKLDSLRAKIKKDKPEGFYTATRAADLKFPKVDETLQLLRTNGVLILAAQIEDACMDGTFAGNKKLSTTGIFKLNRRLARGEKIEDIFETDEFADFFAYILSH
jgi:predicted ATP-dependent endonuclease of OLD family